MGGATSAGGGTSFTGSGLHVVGNHLEDNGKTVRLLGWNRPGGEYSCIGNKPTVFDGPTDMASLQAMQAWTGFNAIRLPLNETCWLGINGVNSAASGSSYVSAIASYVSLFRTNGIYVILDMHWNAPGSFVASTQMPMADADHALDFWKQVAMQFKADPGVVLDLYNEPHLNSVPKGTFMAGTNAADDWSCWLNGGCTISPQTWEQSTGGYVATGMQPMLDAVRGTGATNLVLAGGENWSGDLSGWAAHAPHDSAANLAASAHVYFKPTDCMGAACYNTVQAFAMATQVPIVTGELGEFDRAHTLIDLVHGPGGHEWYLLPSLVLVARAVRVRRLHPGPQLDLELDRHADGLRARLQGSPEHVESLIARYARGIAAARSVASREFAPQYGLPSRSTWLFFLLPGAPFVPPLWSP